MTLWILLSGCNLLGITGDNGDETPLTDPTEVIEADLSDGAQLSDLDWAHSLFCWPETDDDRFDGAHVLYERDQGADRDWTLRVNPEAGVDVSVYYIQRSPGNSDLPPDIVDAFDCDSTYGFDGANPGQAEVLFVQGHTDFDLVIGVAGADGQTSGEYTLEIWDEPGPLFGQ